jgi:phosphoribosylformylglycinamidine cyclo-ligase
LSEAGSKRKRPPRRSAYAAAGVDIDAGTRAKGRMAELAAAATRPEVIAGVGPFAGLFELGEYRDPVLVASTDSVGTKVKLAALLGRYDGVGVDLVNHCVNDILTSGAEPLFFLDYIGGSGLSEDEKVALVKGVATACRAAGCALLGGETADLPDLYAAGDYDFCGFVVGVVERERIIDGSRIREGDVLLGLPSSGLHTNGYSLVRRVFGVGIGGDPDEERARLDRNYPGLGVTLGEVLLAPHRCYYQELRPLLGRLKGIAHITGGGLIENVPRVLPSGLAARFERGSWRVPPIFTLIQKEGGIDEAEMYRVFNMGLGMVLVCSPEDAEAVRSELREARKVGRVVAHTAGERVILDS